MGRVHLNAGGLGPQEVRMGPRGASERPRRPGDDISPVPSPTRRRLKDPVACSACRATKGVTTKNRVALCDPCRKDSQLVNDVQRLCRREGLPPLGAAIAKGDPYEKLRRQATAASRRLTAKRQRSAGVTTKKGRPRATPPAKEAAPLLTGVTPEDRLKRVSRGAGQK